MSSPCARSARHAAQAQDLLDDLARIDLGQLNPGDLLDETELSETYGVSRTPVREAILYLEALGLVHRSYAADGTATFQTIYPGCYAGRVPHMHFEIYRSTTAPANATTLVDAADEEKEFMWSTSGGRRGRSGVVWAVAIGVEQDEGRRLAADAAVLLDQIVHCPVAAFQLHAGDARVTRTLGAGGALPRGGAPLRLRVAARRESAVRPAGQRDPSRRPRSSQEWIR